MQVLLFLSRAALQVYFIFQLSFILFSSKLIEVPAGSALVSFLVFFLFFFSYDSLASFSAIIIGSIMYTVFVFSVGYTSSPWHKERFGPASGERLCLEICRPLSSPLLCA